ncbi:phage tail tape measure protein [Ensifer sp. MPMI2T]|nr:phage tail tape measure protein [Ensifer sp. MPMI2T]
MSVSKAAKLVLTLVDRVSGPAKGIQSALTSMNGAIKTAGAMAMAPANMMANSARAFRRQAQEVSIASSGMTVGLALAGKSIYDMEDVLNEIEGRRFGKRDIFNLADGTEMSRKAFRQSVIDLVTTIDKESPRNAGEIAKAYNQLVQAGLSHEQVHAILPISVDFAIAGNYDTEEAADRLTNVMTSMQMPQATFDQAKESAQRAADVIAYAANITNADVQQMTESFKYAAPSAAALGIDIEQLAAMFVIQAKRGIKASEAGVSIRAMLTRMVRPTKMAAAALANYNIDLADYLERSKEVSASDVTNALKVGGLDASKAAADIDAILKTQEGTAEKVRRITETITKSVGDSSTMSADTISESVREVLYSFGESLDVERLIEDMQKANIAVSDFFKIFDVRQGARTLSLFSDDVGKWIEDIRGNAAGFSEAMSDVRMQGIVGAVQRLDSAMFGLLRAAADSGVLDSATRAISAFANSINNLAKVNPKLLEIGTYAVIAAAALAPLGFAISGLTAIAGLLVNPITWVVGALGYLAYLNFDKIVGYVGSFGTALRENLGPETTAFINDATGAIKSFFKSFDFDANAAGARHGSALARGLEVTVSAVKRGMATLRTVTSYVIATDEWKASVRIVKSFGKVVVEAGKASVRVFRGWADGVMAFTRSFLKNLSPETVAKITFALSRIRAAFNWLRNGVADVLDVVAGLLSKVDLQFTDLAARAGHGVANLVNKIVNAPWKQWAAQAAAGVQVVFDAIRPVLSSLGNAWSELSGAVSRVVGGLASGVRSFARAFTENLSPETIEAFRTAFEKVKGWLSSLVSAFDGTGAAVQKMLNGIAAAYDWLASVFSKVDLDIDDFAARAGKATAQVVNLFVAMTPKIAAAVVAGAKDRYQAGQQLVQSLWDGAVAKFDQFIAWLKGIPGRIRAAIGNIDLSGMIKMPSLSMPSWLGGSTPEPKAVPTPANNNTFGGPRAEGGPVKRGLTYLVGEKGPELLEMGGAGYVTPNQQLRQQAASGGSSIGKVVSAPSYINHFHFTGKATRDDAEEVLRALDRQLNRSEQVAFGAMRPYGDT